MTDLKELYSEHLKQFLKLAETANKNNEDYHIHIGHDGVIIFSMNYEDDKNFYTTTIYQDGDSVRYSELKENK